MKHILVTGGAGFIGSNFIRYILEREDYHLVNLDKLTYAGNLENLRGFEDHVNYGFIKGDICNRELVEHIIKEFRIDCIINFAAESHVDRSILGTEEFIRTNILGTNTLIEAAKRNGIEKFIQISTDEVYGSLGPAGAFTEETPLSPNSPYSASKASADMLVLSQHRTFGFSGIVTRCSNNYGPAQFPEKLIPLMILNAMQDKKLPVYGDGKNVRDWIFVADHASAILAVMKNGLPGEVYNIGAETEKNNLDVIKGILSILGKPETLIEYVKDRPGHDRRYAINPAKIRKELEWQPENKFEEALEHTVRWYMDNRQWWERVINKDYLKYYEELYGSKYGKE